MSPFLPIRIPLVSLAATVVLPVSTGVSLTRVARFEGDSGLGDTTAEPAARMIRSWGRSPCRSRPRCRVFGRLCHKDSQHDVTRTGGFSARNHSAVRSNRDVTGCRIRHRIGLCHPMRLPQLGGDPCSGSDTRSRRDTLSTWPGAQGVVTTNLLVLVTPPNIAGSSHVRGLERCSGSRTHDRTVS